MNKGQRKDLKSIFKDYPEIKLVYFFGSKARGEAGSLSDYGIVYEVLQERLKDIEEFIEKVKGL